MPYRTGAEQASRASMKVQPLQGSVRIGSYKMNVRLDGRVALVTGAGEGIGRGCALMLAASGAEVFVNDKNSATGEDPPKRSELVVDVPTSWLLMYQIHTRLRRCSTHLHCARVHCIS